MKIKNFFDLIFWKFSNKGLRKMSKFAFDITFYAALIFSKKKYPKLCQALKNLGYSEEEFSWETNKFPGIKKEDVGFLEQVLVDGIVDYDNYWGPESVYIESIKSVTAIDFDNLDVTKFISKTDFEKATEKFDRAFYNHLDNEDSSPMISNQTFIFK